MYILYMLFKRLVGVFFNTLNFLLAGNLPPFACVCLLVEKQGQFLAIKRPGGDWLLPSGFIRWRESPAEAALREAEEETGLRLELDGVIGCHSITGQRIGGMSTLTIVYSATVAGGDLRGSIEGQPRWLDEADLRSGVRPQFAYILDDYLRQREQGCRMEVRCSVTPGSAHRPAAR